MKEKSSIESLVFFTSKGMSYKIGFEHITDFYAKVIGQHETLTPDRTISISKVCKKIGVCVNISKVINTEEKKEIIDFFEDNWGMRNTDFIDVIFEDGSSIYYYVQKKYKQQFSYQKICTDGDGDYGVCFIGSDKAKDEFLEECYVYESGEK